MKHNRTSSYRDDRQYDVVVSECDISSLRFLSEYYEDKLEEYKQIHNLSNREYWRVYKSLQRRKKMIDEELSVRIMNDSATITSIVPEFDSTQNIIYDNHEDTSSPDSIKYISFDEDENGYIVSNKEGEVIDQFTIRDKELVDDYVPKSKKELYKDWDY